MICAAFVTKVDGGYERLVTVTFAGSGHVQTVHWPERQKGRYENLPNEGEVIDVEFRRRPKEGT